MLKKLLTLYFSLYLALSPIFAQANSNSQKTNSQGSKLTITNKLTIQNQQTQIIASKVKAKTIEIQTQLLKLISQKDLDYLKETSDSSGFLTRTITDKGHQQETIVDAIIQAQSISVNGQALTIAGQSVASALSTDNLNQQLLQALSSQGELTQRLKDAGINTAVTGGSFKDNLKNSAVNTVGKNLTKNIGAADLNELTHKLAHAGLGCGLASAKGGDCASGAVGAVVSEFAAELYRDKQLQNNLPKNKQELVELQREIKLIGELASIATAGLFELDAQSSFNAGSNAVENNAVSLAAMGIACAANPVCRIAVIKGSSELLKRAVAMATGSQVADKINDTLENESTKEKAVKEDETTEIVDNSGGAANPEPPEDWDKQKKGTPKGNKRQNKQFSDAIRGLTKDQKKIVHRKISGKNKNYQEIKEIANQVRNKELW
ncbi:Hemagglutinin/hemolysin-related protein [uncultured Candidatus Thioglobus sp.]|nr:Hemagglutinin/hemolysin-related protein [uncultured Candidatus Thioglobus sp.]